MEKIFEIRSFIYSMEKRSNKHTNVLEKSKQNSIKVQKYLLFYTIMLWIAISIRYSIAFWLPDTNPMFHFLKVDFNFFVEDYLYATVILLGGYITLKNIEMRKDKITKFRKFSLISYMTYAVILYIIIPTIWWQFRGFNHTTLPFPFLSEIYMIPVTSRLYHEDFVATFGETGIMIFILSHLIIQILAYGGSFLFGRRAFCSCICPWAGLVAEPLGDHLPVKTKVQGRPKARGPGQKYLKFIFPILIFQLIFTAFASVVVLVYLGTNYQIIPLTLLFTFEQAKIIVVDTLFFGFGFLLFGGRYYCCYCPAGFYMGIMGKLGGQRVETDHNKCIQCGKCNDACKMGIDIMSLAKEGKPVTTYRCVGCDCCIIACPNGCLKFTTRTTRKMFDKRKL